MSVFVKSRPATYLLVIIALSSIAWLSYSISYRYLLDKERTGLSNQLSLFSGDLEAEIEKFSFLPNVLSRNTHFQEVLRASPDKTLIDTVNRDLSFINSTSNTEAVYLMDGDGITIAASNWENKDTFVGGDFSFRPYFKNAMRGSEGRYFALGTASKLRGYYFSSPVFNVDQKPIGVIVVKVNIDQLENTWTRYKTTFLVTDSNGVVFSSNKPNWQFRTIKPLSTTVMEEIVRNQQYPPTLLKPAEFVPDKTHPGTITAVIDGQPHRLLSVDQYLPALKWRIYALLPALAIRSVAISYATLAALFTLLSGALIYLAFAWRRNLQEKLDIKRRSEQQLKEAHGELEQRVIKRTKALSENNQALEQEIIDRRTAEKDLREAQKELVHTAKLATIGQLASGISHELNQPLAAITSYAENAKKFLEMSDTDQTDTNLEEILKLSERMKNITTHLKTFSRKTDDQPSKTDMGQCINNALSLINPRIKSTRTHLNINLVEGKAVIANHIRLEQVLINLFNNALDAMKKVEIKSINIEQYIQEDWIITDIIDSGPGIDDRHLAQIFDAFYTTKSVGVGLGLGLSISSEIIQSFGGKLSASNHKTKGAQFTIELKHAD